MKTKLNRNLPLLTERLILRPWLATPEHVRSLYMLLEKAKAGIFDEMEDSSDEESYTKEMIIEGKVAYIPITGTIGNNVGSFSNMCFDVIDVRDIKGWMDQAAANPMVETIFLDINSPGGEATYVDEVSKLIAEVAKKKDVIAYCSDLMASAAYWMASGATEIWAHPASRAIGSIGAYSLYYDESEAYKKEGIEVRMFSAGKYKTEGFPGTKLSDGYAEIIQKEINDLYAQFAGSVSSNRPQVKPDEIGALTFGAKEALANGLIDHIVEDPSENLE